MKATEVDFREQYINSVINIVLISRLLIVPTLFLFTSNYLWATYITMPLLFVAKYFCKCGVSHKATLLLIDVLVLSLALIMRNHDWVYGIALIPIMAGIVIPVFSRRTTRIVMLGIMIFMYLFDGIVLHSWLDPDHSYFDWLPHTVQFFTFTVLVMSGVEVMLMLSKMLSEQLDKLEAANEDTKVMLRNMSHELRTPLNGIIGLGQVLQMDKSIPESANHMIKTMLDSGNHLLDIINDVLDQAMYSREDHVVRKDIFAPDKVIRDVVTSLNTIVNSNTRIQVTNSTWLVVQSDEKMFRQLINNLLGNAIKFTPKGQITIHSKIIHNDGEYATIEFSIADTGCGIPKEKIEQLGKPFSQIDGSMTRKAQGTGLGLSIVKNILRLLNSELQITSDIGLGSTFKFKLKLRLMENGSLSSNNNIYSHAHFPIIIVDDVRLNATVLSTMLKHNGYNDVFIYENPLDAYRHIIDHPPGLVITDLSMPIMNGFDLIKAIRESSLSLPVVAHSGNQDEETIDRVYACGGSGFLPKPINQDELLNLVEKFYFIYTEKG